MDKICHISTVHRLKDTRIFHKECVSMATAGFDLSLIITHDRKETIDGVKVVPLPKSRGRFHRLTIKTTLAFFKGLKTKSKIYHIHDPELIVIGLLLAIFGKKVIYDMHELVYYQILDKKWLGSTVIRKVIAYFYRQFESLGVIFFSKIALAEKGYLGYFEDNYRSRIKKVIFIRNFPIISLIDENRIPREDTDGKTTLVYAGGLTRIRGIKEICDATQLANVNVELILMGPWESESFRTECLEVNSKVNYKGLKPLPEVFPIMKNADIGLALLHPLQNHMNSSLIKTYEYMACSLPMILSDFPSWKQEFGKFSIFADPNSVEDIAKKIEWAVTNQEEMKGRGAKGRKEVEEKYSWEVEAKKMAAMYNSLLN